MSRCYGRDPACAWPDCGDCANKVDHPVTRGHQMKLAIADPPYLGRSRYYGGTGTHPNIAARDRRKRPGGWVKEGSRTADWNPDADRWDDPASHVELVHRLEAEYDGFAIAGSRDSIGVYLAADPFLWVAVWHKPSAWPPGARIHPKWEPVFVRVPDGRRARGSGPAISDVLTAPHNGTVGFIGAKPPAWTRWVLDLMGYDPELDTVDDLFGGSGAVTAELNQGTLL